MWAVRSSLVSMFVLGFAAVASAEGTDAEPSEEEMAQQLAEFDASLTYQTGTIHLPCGKADLALPDGYRYLGPQDTDRVLQLWGNPPEPNTEGMLVPSGVELYADEGWAVVLSYSDEGHVDDSDAASIDYDKLLEQMKASSREDNVEREKLGLATGDLLGWAEPPHYDARTRKLYWAQQLHFSDSETDTLNYAVRVLGREGVLQLNAVAMMGAIDRVKPEMQTMLDFSEFTAGNRYADYRPGVDRDSGYGVAALVAGGAVAAKLATSKGFWAVLVGVLLAAKKAIALAAVAIAGFFKMIWSKLRGRRDEPAA